MHCKFNLTKNHTLFENITSRPASYGCQFILALLGVTFEVRGHKNVDRDKGGVVIINHQSIIDMGGNEEIKKINLFQLLRSSL